MVVVIKMRGLPFEATAREIRFFFKGLEISEEDIHLAPYGNGKASGVAFAVFQSDDHARKAMYRDGYFIGKRYVNLFLSSMAEMNKILEVGVYEPRKTSDSVSGKAREAQLARVDSERHKSELSKSQRQRDGGFGRRSRDVRETHRSVRSRSRSPLDISRSEEIRREITAREVQKSGSSILNNQMELQGSYTPVDSVDIFAKMHMFDRERGNFEWEDTGQRDTGREQSHEARQDGYLNFRINKEKGSENELKYGRSHGYNHVAKDDFKHDRKERVAGRKHEITPQGYDQARNLDHDRIPGRSDFDQDEKLGKRGHNVESGKLDHDKIPGGHGHDRVSGSRDRDKMPAKHGHERVTREVNHDRIPGHERERVTGNLNRDLIIAEHDHDKVTRSLNHDQKTGGPNNDRRTRNLNRDRITGGRDRDRKTGNHRRTGNPNRERIAGEHDRERRTGSLNSDQMSGRHDHDRRTGNHNHDHITGSRDHNKLTGNLDHDQQTGGLDHDKRIGNINHDRPVTKGPDHDRRTGNLNRDQITGWDNRERRIGNVNHDQMTKGPDHDRRTGNINHDQITGWHNHDKLTGNLKLDQITGWHDCDRVTEDTNNDWRSGRLDHDRRTRNIDHDQQKGGFDHDSRTRNLSRNELRGGLDYNRRTRNLNRDEALLGGCGHDRVTRKLGSDKVSGGHEHDGITEELEHNQLPGHAPPDRATRELSHDKVTGGYDHKKGSGGHDTDHTGQKYDAVKHDSESGDTCVSMAGLPYESTWVEVVKFFEGLHIIGIYFTRNLSGSHAGKPSGKAFVEFGSVGDCTQALDRDYQYIGDRYIKVSRCTREVLHRAIEKEAMVFGKTEVGTDLSLQRDYSNDLRDLVQGYESRLSQDVALESSLGNEMAPFAESLVQHTNPSQELTHPSQYGYAIDDSTQDRAMNQLARGANINMNDIKAGCVVGIRNLPSTVNAEEILDFFYGFHVIPDSIRIHYLAPGRSSGDAIVTFIDSKEAKSVTEQLNNKPVGRRNVQLFPVS